MISIFFFKVISIIKASSEDEDTLLLSPETINTHTNPKLANVGFYKRIFPNWKSPKIQKLNIYKHYKSPSRSTSKANVYGGVSNYERQVEGNSIFYDECCTQGETKISNLSVPKSNYKSVNPQFKNKYSSYGQEEVGMSPNEHSNGHSIATETENERDQVLPSNIIERGRSKFFISIKDLNDPATVTCDDFSDDNIREEGQTYDQSLDRKF